MPGRTLLKAYQMVQLLQHQHFLPSLLKDISFASGVQKHQLQRNEAMLRKMKEGRRCS